MTDTGRGIDPAAIATIFTLFARAASDVRGFGVGLAATRRLVELHGGTIQARSDGVGRGGVGQPFPRGGPGPAGNPGGFGGPGMGQQSPPGGRRF